MKTLLKDVEQLKNVLGGISKEMFWRTWQPGIEGAALMYIMTNIGDELYEQLAGLSEVNSKQARLIRLLQYSEGFYAYYDLYPQLVTSAGDLGITMPLPDKTAAMPKWLFQVSRTDLLAKAEEWLEKAIEYLENNADAFPIWKASNFYTIQKGLFISSVVEMRDAFPASKGSRRLWLLMKDYVRKSQKDYIHKLIGKDLYTDLVVKSVDPEYSWTDHEAEAMRILRECLANHAFYKSLPFLNLDEDFRILQQKDANFNEAPDQNRMTAIWNSCQSDYQAKAAELRKYLDDHASDQEFVDYFNSGLYANKPSTLYKPFPNDPSKPYVVL